MKNLFKFTLILFVSALIATCSKKDETPADLEINNFIWKGLNAYYLWQSDIPDLADTRFSSVQQLNAYLGLEPDHDAFFESLLYQRDIVDKWSWIVDDYIALENALQGITIHNGMEFGLVAVTGSATDIFGYVRYVLPGTDAETKNLQRGMLFHAVNGTQLTRANYSSLLFSSDSYSIDLADYNNGTPIGNGTSITLTKSAYQENPIFITKTITSGSKKIGYLMYNAFTSSFDSELNAAILSLQASGITDLIIDVRYNGGGSVRTAGYFASMVTGQFTGQLFAKQFWNSKVNAAFPEEDFLQHFSDEIASNSEAINSLGLSQVYFITTGSSASASELIINGLNPYIDVKLVGTKTHGKYTGSVTLYDSENFTRSTANPNHTWAMQPIVLEIKNKLGVNDKDGFDPHILLAEDYENLGVLGELSDPLLQRTITYITTGAKGGLPTRIINAEEISNSKLALPTGNNMYVDFNN